MTDNEKLIEEVAKAIARATDEYGEFAGSGSAQWDIFVARAALAVFEKAHTPTDDERKALAAEREEIARIIDGHIDMPVSSRLAIARSLQGNGFRRSAVPEPSTEHQKHGDARRAETMNLISHGETQGEPWCTCSQVLGVHATGCAANPRLRREPQGEPSDAQVEAAAQAMFEPDGPGGEYTWAEMVAEDQSRADIWRADARKVLRAASVVTEPQALGDWDRVHDRPATIYTPPEDRIPRPAVTEQGENR